MKNTNNIEKSKKSQPSYHALVVGEALVDIFTPYEGKTINVCGGSPANVALGLGRLERPVYLATWIAKDSNGNFIKNHLEESGVKLTLGSENADFTSTAKATLDKNGNATYDFNISWQPVKPINQHPIILHVGSIGAILQSGKQTVKQIIEEYKNTATITYDPNIRPTIIGDRNSVYKEIINLATQSDILKASHEDMQWLEPNKTHAEFADFLISKGVSIVVITLAEKGVWVKTKSGITKTYPTSAKHVVDTVGAGDSFMAGIIDGLWSQELLGKVAADKLAQINEQQLDYIINHASKIAAITISRKGANLPYLIDLNI